MPTPPPSPPDPADRLPDLIAQALDLPAAGRDAFLERACAGDTALLAEARSLLGHDDAEGFLEKPAFALDRAALGLHEGGELTPGARLGDCEVVRFLGEGGMGEVYLAQDTRLERCVAVKLLKRHLDEEAQLRRFRHERRVLAGLTHPGIARLYGGGTTPQGRSFLVMEYVEGEPLDRFCEQRGLGVPARLALFRKVCVAVSYAHQNLVVHRDLKPANVRVTAEGEPKLLDFGIAKLLEPEGSGPHVDLTVTMQGAMTPEYASPEQIKGEPITTASDVYSLGVILYELLCGQRPYQLKSRRPDELARAICEEEPPRPSTVAGASATGLPGTPATRLRQRLAGDLDNIVAKALHKEPVRRYASVAALADDLRRHGEGLPVSARRDTLGYRTGKFVRRNKTGVAAAALVVTALVVGLVAAVWQARVADQQRDRAQAALAQAKVAQRQAEHVSGFLQSMLAGADPAKLGKDVRVVQVVDAAAANLDRDLADEPEVLIQAHLTLGRTYRNLGLFEPAEQQVRAALTLVRRLHGAEALSTANVELDLGEILANRIRTAEAEPLLRHALSIHRAQNPPDRAAVASALSTLGYTLYNQPGRIAEADAIAAEAVACARGVWGERNPKYLSALNQAATVKVGEHDYGRAADIFRQIISLQDQTTPGAVDSLAPQWNLCVCLFNLEKYAELETALDRLDADAHRLVGENSLQATIVNVLHGLLSFARGENQVAIPYLQKALDRLSVAYPPEALTVVQCQAVLGLCLTRDGRAAEGEKWLRTAREHSGKVDRAEFDHTLGNLDAALGECLLAQGRYAEAEPLLLTGLDDLEKRLGAQNRLTAQAHNRLHDLYVAWNKPTEAARFVRDDAAAREHKGL